MSILLFSVGERAYSFDDLVAAARQWGDWFDLEKEIHQGIACLHWAREQGMELDGGDVAAAAAEFRYRRDLITSEETEAWLEQWEFSAEEWMDAMRRSVLRNQFASLLDAIETCHPANQGDVDACSYIEAVCSNRFSCLAQKLAARAATFHGTLDEQSLEHLEASYENFCRCAVTAEAIRNQVMSHRLEWIRLECRYVLLPDEDKAREALLCIREDGVCPDEVAATANAEVHAGSFYLHQLDVDLWNSFLVAQKGDWVGPVPWIDQSGVFLLRDKVLPSAEDPEIYRLAENALVNAVVGQEVAKRVTWHRRF